MANGGGGPRSRNVRVEALRLAAIVGISLFHTMMPWTAQALCDPQTGCGPIGEALGSDPVMLTVLGVISLMGAWGNHVFFMISGLYLVPSLARRSTQVGYWLSSARGTVRRVLAIAVYVAVVAVAAARRDVTVLGALSYKSTSAASMALAFLPLMACAMGAGREGEDLAGASRRSGSSGSVAERYTAWLAAGILGFYIVQSVFASVVMDAGIQGMLASVVSAGGGWALLAAGVAVSVAYVVAVTVADGLIRRPLLRWMRLG